MQYPAHPQYGYESDEEEMAQIRAHEGSSWWSRWGQNFQRTQATPQSALLTLIPLSDSRLKPRRTKLIIGSLLVLAVLSVCGVFLLVPRGVTVGSIRVHSSQISFNTSQSTYQILLTATLPVFNPNYLPVKLSGKINVSFYDQQAGGTEITPIVVPARAQPQVVEVGMDASSVPSKYLFTIYTQCFTFPEKLIFFLTGQLQAQYLGKTFNLPSIDNYFIISCNQGQPDHHKGHDGDEPPVAAAIAAADTAAWQQQARAAAPVLQQLKEGTQQQAAPRHQQQQRGQEQQSQRL